MTFFQQSLCSSQCCFMKLHPRPRVTFQTTAWMVVIIQMILSCWNFNLPYDCRLLFILIYEMKISIKGRSLGIGPVVCLIWELQHGLQRLQQNCWGICTSQNMSIKSACFCHWHSCIVIMCLTTLCKRIPTEMLCVARVWSFLFNQKHIALFEATRLHWHCSLLCSTPESLCYIDTIDYFVLLCDFGVLSSSSNIPFRKQTFCLY